MAGWDFAKPVFDPTATQGQLYASFAPILVRGEELEDDYGARNWRMTRGRDSAVT